MTDLREINALIDRIRDAGLRSKRHALAHELRHAVSALDAAEGRVTVKPLVWRSARISDRHERFSADSPWGSYEALEWSDGTFGGSLAPVDVDSDGVEFSVEGGMDAAKAYCQADYITRMQPLFTTTPSDKIAEAAGMDVFGARRVIDAYDAANPFRAADMHPAVCHCHRCAIDWLRALAGRA